MSERLDLIENDEEVGYYHAVEKKAVLALNVRNRPEPNAAIVRVLEQGEAVKIVREVDETWVQIDVGAYVMKQYLI